MKSGLFIIVAALLNTSFAFAQTSPEVAARSYLQGLHVSLPQSCEIVERFGRDPSGPFEHIDQCKESEFANEKQVIGKVYRVVDGDTIQIYVKNKLLSIRMLGIDTPELHFKSMAQPKWGAAARDYLRTMVESGDIITLELDQTKCDRYGRILGHVFKGNTNLNFEQIRAGYAVNYCIAPNLKHCNAYALAYQKAAEDRLHMHSDLCAVTPYVWRRAFNGTPMDKKVKDSRSGEVYSPKDYYLVPVAYRIFYP